MTTPTEIQYLAPDALKASANNARSHPDQQINQVAASLLKFDFINPIIMDENGFIVAGHARWLAAKKLRLATVPCIEINHLSEAELRAYMLADNKIAANAGWHEDILRIELEYLSSVEVDFSVHLTGFEVAEVDLIIGSADTTTSDEIPIETLTPPAEPISQTGDVWQLDQHRLACGDCRDEQLMQRLFDGERATMVFTDPPYNVKIQGHVSGLGRTHHREFVMANGELSEREFHAFLSDSLRMHSAFSIDGSLHYVFMDWRHLQILLSVGEAVYDKLLNLCVWAKTNGGMGSLYRSQHELIPIFKKGTVSHANNVKLGKHRYRTNLWTYPGTNTFSKDRAEALSTHPTVKPNQLVADAILDVTEPGQIVLDGFMGSGTTLLAAELTKRRCFGVEIDPGYVDVAIRRWTNATGKVAIHQATGKPFDESTTIHEGGAGDDR